MAALGYRQYYPSPADPRGSLPYADTASGGQDDEGTPFRSPSAALSVAEAAV